MKKLSIAFITLMVFGLGTFISCDKEDEVPVDSELLGTWEIEIVYDDSDIADENIIAITILNAQMTFNTDNKGATYTELKTEDGDLLESQTESFTYSTNGNKLTITIDGDSDTSTYSISGNKLTISFYGETMVLTKM